MNSFIGRIIHFSEIISDILNMQTIMEEGKINELTKYIQSILNYNFGSHSDNTIEITNTSLMNFLHVAQFIIRFLLYWKSELQKDNIKLKNKCLVCL